MIVKSHVAVPPLLVALLCMISCAGGLSFRNQVEVPEEQRKKFFARISEIVGRHGTIAVPVLTTLIICKKRSGFLHAIANPKGGK